MHKILKSLAVLMIGTGAMFSSIPSYASEAGDILIRLRGIGVIPDDGGNTTIGGEPDLSNSYVPELDISYFFTKNIAAELILATTKHNAKVKNITGGGGADLGDVMLLPPTLTVQYHFTNFGKFKPYVGAGVNYTIFYNADGANGLDVDYDNNFGAAAQIGMDYELNDVWSLNLDVKRLWLNTDATINGGAIKGDVDVDPWIVGVGIGYRF